MGDKTEIAALKNKINELKNRLSKYEEVDDNCDNCVYKNIFNKLPTGLFYYDNNGVIKDCNSKFTEIVGAPKEKLIGLPTLTELKNEQVVSNIKQSLKFGQSYFEGKYTSVTGNKEIYSKGIFLGLKDDIGKITKGICMIEDITELHAIQNNIKIAEENYRAIFDNSPIPMVIHANGKILLANNATVRVAKLDSVDEIIGESILKFVHKDFQQSAKVNMQNILNGKPTVLLEEKFVTTKGDVLNVLVSTCLYNYNGQDALLVAFIDVSELKLFKKQIDIITKGIENARVSVIITDNNWIIDYVNINFTNLTRYSLEEVKGKSIDIVKSEVHSIEFYRNIEELLQKGESWRGEICSAKKNGELYWEYAVISPLLNKKNELVNIISVREDITQRRIYEKKIKESDIKFKLLSDYSTDVIWTMNLKGEYTFISPSIYKQRGYTQEEFLKLPREKHYMPDSAKIVKEALEKSIRKIYLGEINPSNFTIRLEVKHILKDGSWKWGEVISTPIVDENNKMIAIHGITRDIHDKKIYEEKLENRERHLQTIFETAPDGIFEIDKKGNIVVCNAKFAKSVKLDKKSIINTPALNYIKDKNEYKKLFKELIDKGYIESNVVQINSDGTYSDVWRKARSIYDYNNIFTGAIVFNSDISEIKRAEQILIEAKEKAEESDKLKSAFLSNMSHEIRTPLNAIIGFSSLLTKQDIDDATKETYNNYIKQSSSSLINIIDDIIDFSKIEANQLEISKDTFSVNILLDEIYNIFSEELKLHNKNNVELRTNYNDNVLLKSDEYRLKQILSNLLSNAIKCTIKGNIEFGYNVYDNTIIFYVSDTGIGISDDKLDIIFKQFVKFDSTKKQKGTGIGLSIVSSLTELLGGEVKIDSKIGKGTRFEIILPYDKNIKSNISKKDDGIGFLRTVDWSGRTILVAEDDEFNTVVIDEFLSPTKANVIFAKDGEEALLLYKKLGAKINIILMDVQMPKLNGYETTKEILKINPDVKIIAQTAYAMPNERQESFSAGCCDYITKPIDEELLIEIISRYI